MKSNKLGKSTDIYFSGIIMDDVIWVHGGTIVENRVHDKKSYISVMNLFELYKTAYTPREWHQYIMDYAKEDRNYCNSKYGGDICMYFRIA